MGRFVKATRKKSKARVALVGPSGSGKTYTALLIARGVVGPEGRIAVIDTERGSASKYSDLTDFDALDLEQHAPAEYVKAIRDAAAEKYDVLVIDSLSHAWAGRGGALEQVDLAAKRSGGNSFAAWRDVTPQHNQLVDAILAYPGHVIVTMRAKTEYVMEQGKNGKTTPRKVGLAPVQRDGMEYEFDVVADIDLDHNFIVTKSRCSALADAVIPQAGANVADVLRTWLDGGEAAAVPTPKPEPSEGALSNALAGTPGTMPAAMHATLWECVDPDQLREWLIVNETAFGALDKPSKRVAWDEITKVATGMDLDDRALRSLADEARAANAQKGAA